MGYFSQMPFRISGQSIQTILILYLLITIVIMYFKNHDGCHSDCPSIRTGASQINTKARVVKLHGRVLVVVFPPGLVPQTPWIPSRMTWDNTTKTAERAYKDFTSKVSVECRERARIGNHGDGGWDMCLVGPYRPGNGCLVYSFGVQNDWSFEEHIIKEFGCQMKSFDPTVKDVLTHTKNRRQVFYPIALSDKDGKIDIANQKYEAQTLNSIIYNMGDTNRVIDYLKFDIEGSEWVVLRDMLANGLLTTFVKQIGFEAHTYGVKDAQIYRTYMDILKELETQGFIRWHVSWNKGCTYPSVSGNCFTYCQEMYYINGRFLSAS